MADGTREVTIDIRATPERVRPVKRPPPVIAEHCQALAMHCIASAFGLWGP